LRRKLWKKYVWHRQTLGQLAQHYQRSIPWIQSQLDGAAVTSNPVLPQRVVALADATYFGRGYGILVVRCPRLKKNIHCHEIRSETPEEYIRARKTLEAEGYIIEAAVIDGKRGILRVFCDIPVQFCQFHQIAIVRRYLTSRPKLEAGQELKAITLSLTISNENNFTQTLNLWYDRWHEFLKERSYSEDGKHWQHTHRRIRSAYRSLRTNLPYLFTYQEFPELKIPNTTNSLDGYFSKLKQLLNVHRGMTVKRRYKLIQEILA
jgi:hypothetical protein